MLRGKALPALIATGRVMGSYGATFAAIGATFSAVDVRPLAEFSSGGFHRPRATAHASALLSVTVPDGDDPWEERRVEWRRWWSGSRGCARPER